MRHFRRKNFFDVVINLFTSFGYFEREEDDYRVIENVYASLKKNGVFLIELLGKEVLARIFQKRDWYERDGYMILENREPVQNWRSIKSRWIILRGARKKNSWSKSDSILQLNSAHYLKKWVSESLWSMAVWRGHHTTIPHRDWLLRRTSNDYFCDQRVFTISSTPRHY